MTLKIDLKTVPISNISYWEQDNAGLHLYINNGHKIVVRGDEEKQELLMKLKGHYEIINKVSF